MISGNRGFTLIETIIYIGLFSIIMVGSLAAVFLLLQGSTQTSGKAITQGEQSFVFRKINWALSGINPNQPIIPASGYSDNLSLYRYTESGPDTKIEICRSGTTIYMREDGAGGTCGDGSYLPLTSESVEVTALTFYTPLSPMGIFTTMTIDGQTVIETRYVRK